MNRRTLIKTLGISAVGLATVPLWMDSWSTEDLPEDDGFLTGRQRLQLQAMVNTLIPGTDTPGAKELEVDRYISVFVRDCYKEEIKAEFLSGFNELDTFSRKFYDSDFIDVTEPERNDIVCSMEAMETIPGGKINFVGLVKDLTISGYMSSRYIMENHLNYELVPSRFNGSFPVNQTVYTNA